MASVPQPSLAGARQDLYRCTDGTIYSDRPGQEAMGLWRERREESGG